MDCCSYTLNTCVCLSNLQFTSTCLQQHNKTNKVCVHQSLGQSSLNGLLFTFFHTCVCFAVFGSHTHVHNYTNQGCWTSKLRPIHLTLAYDKTGSLTQPSWLQFCVRSGFATLRLIVDCCSQFETCVWLIEHSISHSFTYQNNFLNQKGIRIHSSNLRLMCPFSLTRKHWSVQWWCRRRFTHPQTG